jgi:hypothetical protein
MFVVPYILVTYMFYSIPTGCTIFFISFLKILALHVSDAICTHHQEHDCSVQPYVIQGVPRLYVITAGDDFLGLCDEKSSYKHVSDFGRLRSYDGLTLKIEGDIIDNKRNKILNQHNT